MGPIDGFAKKNWFVLACASLALVITCMVSSHFSSIRQVSPLGIGAAWGFLLLFMVMVVITYLTLKKRVHGYQCLPLLLLAGFGILLKALILFTPISSVLGGSGVFATSLPKGLMVAEMLGLFFCGDFFLQTGDRNHIKGFAISLLAAGVCMLLPLLLSPSVTRFLVLSFAVLAMPLLYLAGRGLELAEPSSEDPFIETGSDRSVRPLIIFTIMVLLVTLVTDVVFHRWATSGVVSGPEQAIQVADIIATLLSGNIILLLLDRFRSLEFIEQCADVVIMVVVATLYLSQILDGTYAYTYLVPVKMAQKFALFFTWTVPLFYGAKHSEQRLMGAGVICYSFGCVLSTFVFGSQQQQQAATDSLHVIIEMIVCIALLLIAALSMFLSRREAGQDAVHEQAGMTTPEEPEVALRRRFSSTCDELAEEYGFTQRETEVFHLLAKGRSAEYIAKRLVISSSTARVHTGHIYQKMGVGSQQELLDVVEERVWNEAEDGQGK